MFSLHLNRAGHGRGPEIEARHCPATCRGGATVMLNDLDAGPLASRRPSTARTWRERPYRSGGGVPAATGGSGHPENWAASVTIVARATQDNIIQKTSDEQFEDRTGYPYRRSPFRILQAAAQYIRDTAKASAEQPEEATARKPGQHHFHFGYRWRRGTSGVFVGKAAVIGLTRAMAKEWGRYNVNVNAVGFGLIQTRLIQPLTWSKIEMKGHEIRVGGATGDAGSGISRSAGKA